MDWVHITPKLVTTRRSILGPPAEGRPGPSDDNDDNNNDESNNNDKNDDNEGRALGSAY